MQNKVLGSPMQEKYSKVHISMVLSSVEVSKVHTALAKACVLE